MRIVVSLAILCCFLAGRGQHLSYEAGQGVKMKHRVKKTVHIIPLDSKVSVRTLDGEKVRGFLRGITSKHVIVDSLEIPIRDMHWISHRTIPSKLKAVGLAILGIGIGFSGPALISDGGESGVVNGGLITAAGAGFLGLSIAQYRNGRKFYVDSDWKIQPPQ